MTPVAFLAAFCGCLTLVAAARIAIGERIDRTDVAVVSIVAGITILALLWALVDAGSSFGTLYRAIAALAGVAIVGGAGFLVRTW